MLGQWCELLCAGGAGCAAEPVCPDVVVVVVPVVDVAALAIAAPPPASAPVTASAATRGLILRIVSHLLWRSTAGDDPPGVSEGRRRRRRVRFEPGVSKRPTRRARQSDWGVSSPQATKPPTRPPPNLEWDEVGDCRRQRPTGPRTRAEWGLTGRGPRSDEPRYARQGERQPRRHPPSRLAPAEPARPRARGRDLDPPSELRRDRQAAG